MTEKIKEKVLYDGGDWEISVKIDTHLKNALFNWSSAIISAVIFFKAVTVENIPLLALALVLFLMEAEFK